MNRRARLNRLRVLRYALPRRMIEKATRARLAGDWRGACAAAWFDVGPELDAVPAEVEGDLRHLAPDLLRWHVPRIGDSGISSYRMLVLARYGDIALYVRTPPGDEAPQRLRLCLGAEPLGERVGGWVPLRGEDWTGLRHLWDARRSGELLARRFGGDRAPFLRPDGTPLGEDELPGRCPGHDDPVAHTEWVTRLHERGQEHLETAYRCLGLDRLGGEPDPGDMGNLLHLMREPALDLYAFARALREAHARGAERVLFSMSWADVAVTLDGMRVEYAPSGASVELPSVPQHLWHRMPDLELLRTGLVTPEELHPLVRDALCPARPPADGPVGPPVPEPPAPVTIRCQGEDHEIAVRDGRLVTPHSPEELQRERALRAFGGTSVACLAVLDAWTTGEGKLPAKLREIRLDLFRRVHAGDTESVLALLDAGFDPHVRDAQRRTLLHHVHRVDHRMLLPRLLAAGLDVNAEDGAGRTPLMPAVGDHGSPDVVRALLEAGARVDVADHLGNTLSVLIRGRDDLGFLAERLPRDEGRADR
ncbi:ankyrin repeat domain-containing protein [Actinomadura kijaniata]|uniref:ankyrin repeat domain-containing protein n=1 Tax=Actinomadura kijaniata TaxID=46161 RepID=UPI0008324A88|nr:ankyrin repeat domain-containing protein [Actinomadura kijaniata]